MAGRKVPRARCDDGHAFQTGMGRSTQPRSNPGGDQMMRVVALSVVVAASASMFAAAQQPVRDTSSTPAVGTARVSGQVLTAGTDPKPLRRVIVTITGDGMRVGRSTVTDD